MWPSLFHLTRSLTGEAPAVGEVQFLHAFGEDECTDITGEASAATEEQVLHASDAVASQRPPVTTSAAVAAAGTATPQSRRSRELLS